MMLVLYSNINYIFLMEIMVIRCINVLWELETMFKAYIVYWNSDTIFKSFNKKIYYLVIDICLIY